MLCPKCGAEIKSTGAYCGRCGMRLPGRGPAKAPVPAAAKRPWVWVICAVAVCLALAAAVFLLTRPRGDPAPTPAETAAPLETAAPIETAAPVPAETEPPAPTPTPLPDKDPFADAELVFSGVSGEGTAALTLSDPALDPEDFVIEPRMELHNGDRVTLRYRAAEPLAFRPTRTELRYTVSGLAEYVTALSGISPAALEDFRADARARLGAEAVEAGMAFSAAPEGAQNELAVLWAVPGARPLDGPQYTALYYRNVTDADNARETAERAAPETVPDPWAWVAALPAAGFASDEALGYYAAGDGWVRDLSDLTPAALEVLRADACAVVRASLEGEYAVSQTQAVGECFVFTNDPDAAAEDAGVLAVVVQALIRENGESRTLYVPAGYAMLRAYREGCSCGLEVGALEQEGVPVRFSDLKTMYRALRLTVGLVYDFELSSELRAALEG